MELRINVLAKDLNPHPPVFINKGGVYQSSIPYTAQRGYALSIVNFNATDEDTSQSIAYSIVSGNVRDLFAFDSATLLFTLQYELDETIPPVLNIIVKATDYGNFSSFYSKTATATLVVTVNGESTPCHNASSVAALSSQAENFKLYQGLFIAVVILLAISILICLILVHKLRAAGSVANSKRASDYTVEPANTTATSLSPMRSGANTPGFPPELPRRTGGAPQSGGQNTSGESGFASMPYSSDPSWDSGGYLRPSERGDSDRQYPGDDKDHESLEPGEMSETSAGYIRLMADQPPRHQFHKSGSAGIRDVVSPQDVYIHPVSDRQDHGTYLQTSRESQAPRVEASGTYLRALPGPREQRAASSLSSSSAGLNASVNSGHWTNADRDTSDGRRSVETHKVPRVALHRPSPLGFSYKAPETQLDSSRPGFAVRFPGHPQPQALSNPIVRSTEDLARRQI